jgi:hypothetical protein
MADPIPTEMLLQEVAALRELARGTARDSARWCGC